MIVVTNRIAVSKEHEADFEARFKSRVHLVDQSPGFIRNEVHRPRPMKMEKGSFVDDPEGEGFYEVKTWWRSMEDFEAWMKSPSFREAHKDRPPEGMMLGNSLEVRVIIQSTDLDVDEPAP